MPVDNSKNVKYVYMFVIMIPLLILGSLCVEFNIIDLIYLIFLAIAAVRYMLVCIKK